MAGAEKPAFHSPSCVACFYGLPIRLECRGCRNGERVSRKLQARAFFVHTGIGVVSGDLGLMDGASCPIAEAQRNQAIQKNRELRIYQTSASIPNFSQAPYLAVTGHPPKDKSSLVGNLHGGRLKGAFNSLLEKGKET